MSHIKFATVLVLSLGLISCNTNQTKDESGKDSKEYAEEQNEAKFDDEQETDAQFMVTAAEINLEEIQLADLAQINSTNPDVLALAKMMKTDHEKVLKEMQVLATSKQITIPLTPTEKGQDAYKKLMDKKGSDFDKEYTDMMVKGHQKAIKKFEKASEKSTDADIKAWATSLLPSLRMHLEHSENTQKKVK